ncbi:hypothetical protein [Undibacterium sp. Xuan67W]|uniref:hypothetical protein n=1 Tax=Undibacterium sp. Xuan67W TaxID=3413057 RepID=UPI003BF10790
MAEKKTPPEGFLRQFKHPLWKAAKLDNLRAVSIVEGRRDTFAFTVLELEHCGTGLLTDESSREVSTVFIIYLNKASSLWALTHTPPDAKVWVDDSHVYLSRLGRRTPVKDWSHLLEQAIAVAETLVERPPDDIKGGAAHTTPRVSQGMDIKTVAFWFAITGIAPTLEWAMGINVVASVLQEGYYGYCPSGSQTAVLRVGADAWLFGLALCLPLLGHVAGIATRVHYYGRPGFGWRMAIVGAATLVLAIAGIVIAFKHTEEVGHLKDGTTVPCYRVS